VLITEQFSDEQNDRMKIELNEEAAWTFIVLIIAAAFTSVLMHGCSESEQTYREKVNAGMIQKTVPSRYISIWTKPE
jgi:hypothetical protein